METDANQASREEKEAKITQRMEEMRLKNAALQKRHQEVLADKRNAEDLSHKFQESRQLNPTQPHVGRAPAKSRPPPAQRSSGRARYNEMIATQPGAGPESEKKRAQRLTEDDGPPPDPGYSFLSDRRREGGSQHQQQLDERNQGSRRHAGNYGGQNFENVRSSMQKRKAHEKGDPRQGPQNKMEMAMRMTGRERREYEQWKNERSRIEEDRVNRHKTSSGEWRREWDRDKNSTDEEPEPTHHRDSRRGGGVYRGSNRGNWPRSGPPQRAEADNSSRYTSEHDHQRGEFVQQGSDFPSLTKESGGDSAVPSNADGRKIEINSNTIKVCFSTDKNDNQGGNEREPEPARWRNKEGRNARQPANTSRHSGPASSQSEDEVAGPRRGTWRTPRNEQKTRGRVAPSSDWRDKKRQEKRQVDTATFATHETPASLYSDLREVLNRAAASTSSEQLPPIIRSEPTDTASGGDREVGATAVDDAWEDDASWEDAASGVGSSQGFSSDMEAEGGPSNLVRPLPDAGQSLGDGIRDLYIKNSELLMTNMSIIDISLAGHDLEQISLGTRHMELVSLGAQQLDPISITPHELEQNLQLQGDLTMLPQLEIDVFRDADHVSDNVYVEEEENPIVMAFPGVDQAIDAVNSVPDAPFPKEYLDAQDPDEVYYSDPPDLDSESEDRTIEDAEPNHANDAPPPAVCPENEDLVVPIDQLEGRDSQQVIETVAASDRLTESQGTSHLESQVQQNYDYPDNQVAVNNLTEDTNVKFEMAEDDAAENLEPSDFNHSSSADLESLVPQEDPSSDHLTADTQCQSESASQVDCHTDIVPPPESCHEKSSEQLVSGGDHASANQVTAELATVDSSSQIDNTVDQPSSSHHSESAEPVHSRDDHATEDGVFQPVCGLHQVKAVAEQSDDCGAYELELSPSLNSTFGEDQVDVSATSGEHETDVEMPVGDSEDLGSNGEDPDKSHQNGTLVREPSDAVENETSEPSMSSTCDPIGQIIQNSGEPNREPLSVERQLESVGSTHSSASESPALSPKEPLKVDAINSAEVQVAPDAK